MRRIGILFPVMLAWAFGLCAVPLLSSASAAAAPAAPGWSIRQLAQPTNFSSTNNAKCEHSLNQICDIYVLLVQNVGSGSTVGGATITDTLPAGVHVVHVEGEALTPKTSLACSMASVQCFVGEVPPGEVLEMKVFVTVDKSIEEVGMPSVHNSASVSGGGAPAVTFEGQTTIDSKPATFGIADFSLRAFGSDGALETQAGGHPYALATSVYLTSSNAEVSDGEAVDHPVEEPKDIIVDLPQGLLGNPQTLPKCPLYALLEGSERTLCPRGSRIGTIAFDATPGVFRISGGFLAEVTAVYNLVPEPGFPAEFGFTFLSSPVIMYASSVRIGSNYRLRVTAPGIPQVSAIGVSLLFFGNPAEQDGGMSLSAPFFANPVDCVERPRVGHHGSRQLGAPREVRFE